MRSVLITLGLLGLSGACGEGAGKRNPQVAATRKDAGPVVARVNGEAIGLEEVRAVCAASGLSPELALARLVDERVLAQYAEQRGYGDLAETQTELARARVRALLGQTVEAPASRSESGSQTTQSAAREPQQGLDDLLKQLRAKTKVVYDESAVRRAMSDDRTLGPGT